MLRCRRAPVLEDDFLALKPDEEKRACDILDEAVRKAAALKKTS